MKMLKCDDLDIVGFAGIRERILVMDPTVFGHHVKEDSWHGFQDLTYLADAYFTSGGQTGLHEHSGVDIVSVITKGPIYHEGTLGHGESICEGQVLIQSAGPINFKHNEMNPDRDIKGMVQLWLRPSSKTALCQNSALVNLNKSGVTPIYGYEPFSSDTVLDVHVLPAQEVLEFEKPCFAYLYKGNGAIREVGVEGWQSIVRGTLIDTQSTARVAFKSDQEARWIIIYRNEP